MQNPLNRIVVCVGPAVDLPLGFGECNSFRGSLDRFLGGFRVPVVFIPRLGFSAMGRGVTRSLLPRRVKHPTTRYNTMKMSPNTEGLFYELFEISGMFFVPRRGWRFGGSEVSV